MKTTIIGARTRSLREHRNWSQEDLARESGLKRPHISLIETGDRMPGADTLAKLADALQVSVDFLMGRSDNPAIAPSPNDPALHDPLFSDLLEAWRLLSELADLGDEAGRNAKTALRLQAEAYKNLAAERLKRKKAEE